MLIKIKLLCLLSCLSIAGCGMALKEKILIVGTTSSTSSILQNNLSKVFEVHYVDISKTDIIDIQDAKIILLLTQEALPSSYRLPIHNFLNAGGSLVAVGPHAFDYAPKTINAVSVATFDDDYDIIWPKRKVAPGSVDKPEIKNILSDGRKGLQFVTKKRGMRDVMLRVPLKGKASNKRNVVRFKAKGSHFMDLMALEVTDAQGKKWYSFAPLEKEWKEYHVSFADFIPEGWSDENKPYPLLNPEQIDSIAMGINTMTVWKEKAMDFSISDLTLAENTGVYTPTSLLQTLSLPFKELGIASPQWIYDPFFRATPVQHIQVKNSGTYFSPATLHKGIDKAWYIPSVIAQHPGTAMGTDTKKAYDNKDNRLARRIKIMEDSGSGHVVATFVQYGGKKYKDASVAIFGFNPSEVVNDQGFADCLLAVSNLIVSKPRITTVHINTTVKEEGKPIRPLLKVDVYNPGRESVKAKIRINVNTTLQKETEIILPAHSSKVYNVELPVVPQGFSFHHFDWQVNLVTDKGEDRISDVVDVERAMLIAFRYLVQAQKSYPDGRYSNHYFGDAYGVRAMFAYLDYLDKNPERLNENKDIWRAISKDDIKKSATWFYDMLAQRQTADGAYPMGYSEHTQGYNVADGGQIGLSMAQSLRYIGDPVKKEQYLNSVIKFGNWAEGFYIDSVLSQQLKTSHPKEYKKGDAQPGFYGLGQTRTTKRRTGPSWVLADIIASQIALSHLASDTTKAKFESIAERNSIFYVNKKFNAVGYYQAEALFWIYLNTQDEELKKTIRENLAETFLKPLYKGKENDMYELGARSTLKALPLLYYQRFIEDNPDVRAVLLKYIWSFGSESSTNSMRYLAEVFPKPVHGESLTVAKYAALSSLWAMELLYPQSSLIKF